MRLELTAVQLYYLKDFIENWLLTNKDPVIKGISEQLNARL